MSDADANVAYALEVAEERQIRAERDEQRGHWACASHAWRSAAVWFAAAHDMVRAQLATDRSYGADAKRQQPATALGIVAPALDRWRQQVLESGQRRTPLERAAAWEATALECDRRGLAEQARHAREHARSILLSTPSRVA